MAGELPTILSLEMVQAGLPKEDGSVFHARNPEAFMRTYNAINAAIEAGEDLTKKRAQEMAATYYSGKSPGSVPAEDASALGLIYDG